ncbi:MAG: hypothetical protein JST49_06345 [Bacteroidetes bacterium]|nr:hypothetical protein [Bacteroidota bacterium]
MVNVLELLEKINRTANRLGGAELSKLEYDLLMQQVRNLYDELDTLRHAKTNVADVTVQQVEQPAVAARVEPIQMETPVVPPVQQVQPIVQQTIAPVTIPVVEEEPVPVAQTVATPVQKPIIEFIQEPVQEVIEEPIQQQAIVQEPIRQEPVTIRQQPVVEQKPVYHEPVAVLEDEPALLNHNPITDTVEKAVPINERIKGSTDLNERWRGATTEIHQRYAMKPLKDMLDLNRRIAFVNDLFKGNSDELNKAVQTIDAATDYEVAKAYVNSLARTWNWYESSQSAKLFVKLVKQRFGEE